MTTGQNTTIVLLHGFTGDASTMEPLGYLLRDRGHRALTIDLVGHGRGPHPPETERYEMAAVVGDVNAAIADVRGPVVLLGYSMGGRVALSVAAVSRELTGLVLIGASAGIADPVERATRVRTDEALADRIERAGIEAFVDEWMANPLFATQSRLGPEYLAAARHQRLDNDPSALARSLRGMGSGAQPPLHDQLGSITAPTLLVVGELDTKFHSVATDLAARLPDATVAVIPDAGHAAHIEQPAEVAQVVSAWVGSISP